MQQKIAESAADVAIVANRIKIKLLQKLEKEIDALPDGIGSEKRDSTIDHEYEMKKGDKVIIGNRPLRDKETSKTYNLRDLTTAYKNLTSDIKQADDSGTMEKLDKLWQEVWDAAHTETS